MQWATYLKNPICELMYPVRRLGTVLSTSHNNSKKLPINRIFTWPLEQSANNNRSIHTTVVCERHANQVLRIQEMRKKKNKNLVEKFLKGQKKKSETKVYEIWPNITVKELANVLCIDAEDAYDIVRSSGHGNTVYGLNSPIIEHAIIRKFREVLECKFNTVSKINLKKEFEEEINKDVIKSPISFEDLVPRPPVVALVGHIDHGKTTLLDRLRSSSVVDTECGGITQHIGSFSLNLGENQKMTFLDTPGHAAFKSMRVRGTNITDIVILVVDAAEGPLEQTVESLRAIRQSQCNMIVAINKIDKPSANIKKTKEALQDLGVQFEEDGGNVPCVPISALVGTNVDELIETVIVQAEVLQLSGDPKGPVEGTIVESSAEHGFGGTATVLVKRGTLKKGTHLVCGTTYAKVKLLLDTSAALEKEDSRKERSIAEPSDGCKVVGWKGVPVVGAEVLEVESEKRAKEVIQWRIKQEEENKKSQDAQAITKKRELHHQDYAEYRRAKLEIGVMKPRYGWHDFRSRIKETIEDGDVRPKVKIILKCDVDGSKDAILSCLDTYDETDVRLDVMNAEVGEVTQEDVEFASNFEGILYSFNARVSSNVQKLASHLNVLIREYNVIYRLIDDVKSELSLNMPVVDEDVQLGKGVVVQEFLYSEGNLKVPIAGSKVNTGKFDRNSLIKIIRGTDTVIRDVRLSSLKQKKDEVSMVTQGKECGLRLQGDPVRFEPNDEVIFYEKRKAARTIDWDPGF